MTVGLYSVHIYGLWTAFVAGRNQQMFRPGFGPSGRCAAGTDIICEPHHQRNDVVVECCLKEGGADYIIHLCV